MDATIEKQLIRAVDRDNVEELDTLLQNPRLNVNWREPYGLRTAIEKIVTFKRWDYRNAALRILKHPNYDATAIDASGKTILHHVAGDSIEGPTLVRELLDVGADAVINVQDVKGDTALHIACKSGNISVIGDLLAVPGMQPSLENEHGETPMMNSIVWHGPHYACYFLLNGNVSCNEPAQTLSVRSPLQFAIWEGNESLVTRLLEEDAATTFQVHLELLLENNEKAGMETTIFEGENLATYALELCAKKCNFEFELSISIADKLVEACPVPPHDEAVFQLYANRIKLLERGETDGFFDTSGLKATPEIIEQLFSVIYKSTGPSFDGNKLKYLMTKYQLSPEDDSKLIVPFTTKPLMLLGVLKSRELIVERTGARNVVKALNVGEELMNEFKCVRNELNLGSFVNYFLEEVGVQTTL